MPYQRDPKLLDLFDVRNLPGRLRSGVHFPVQIGFLLLLTLLALGTWASDRQTRLLVENQELVFHSMTVLERVRGVLTALLDSESGVRGFAITGAPEHLDAYRSAVGAIQVELGDLRTLTRDNERQQALLTLLDQRVHARHEFLDRIVDAASSGRVDRATALVKSDEGKQLMDPVRDVIAEIESNEQHLLATREAAADDALAKSRTTGVAVGLSGVFLVVVVYQLVRRYDRLRARAAAESSALNERFRVTLGSIGDAILVTDAEGRLTFCNEPCRALLGVTDATMGRPLSEHLRFAAEATGEELECIDTRARRSLGIERTPADSVLLRGDGSRTPVEATAAAILDASGRPSGVVVVVRDVSERRERERELARVNERFRALVLATSQIMWTTDVDGHMKEDSPSWRELTGQTYEQWKGHGWADAVHPGDRERVLDGWRAAVAAHTPHQVEYRIRLADGSYRWTMVRAVPVRDVDGRVREWVGMSHDIQLRKEVDEAQRTANRRKDEFIALLAHELRNPLAPLRNGIEVLKSGDVTHSAQAIELMDRQLNHMVRLIDDLLEVSRINQGKLELRLERFDLRDVVRQTFEAARPLAEAKRQALTLRLPAAPLWIEGDAVRIAQVMTNLLNNAIKYSGEDATIWIDAEREGARQLVTVRDTGQGIPTELRPRIWDMFLQGEGRVERVEGGLGIGLTLVKRIVEMHRGTVDVHSEGVGTGSEFSVRLPASPAPSETSRVQPTAPSVPRPALRILIVDDNEDSAESLSMLLRLRGHEVRTHFRGESGLRDLASFRPHVVLCDIRMPGMNGFDFARAARATAEEPPMLVALTGFGAISDRAASNEAGFDLHLVKPIEVETLERVLDEAARRTRNASEAS